MMEFKRLVLIVLLPVFSRAIDIEDPLKLQSFNKTESNTTDVAWLVSVQVHEWHSCVGSIIGQKWVLTTASCIVDETPDAISLRVGSPSFLNGGSIVHVKRLIPNDKYNSTLHDYDFGLIETNEDFKYTEYIQAIALPSADDNNATDGAVCAVYSWGMTKENSCTDLYLKSIIPIVDHDNCSRIYESIHTITRQMICAGKNTEIKQTCRDDYGSPLTFRDPKNGILKLIGLVSWSKGCGDPNYPGVYAFVESARSWISNNTEI